MSGQAARELAAEFAAVRRLNPSCKKPVFRVSLSLPAGHDLTDADWQRAAEVFLKEMGINPKKHPFCITKHEDTDHRHIHITSSRIGLDGKLAREQRGDYKLAHRAAVAASRAVGLEPMETPDAAARQPTLTKSDRREIEAGETPARLTIAAKLDKAAEQATDWEDFKSRATGLGVEVAEAANSGGVYGVKFRLAAEDDAPWLKGSQVGKAYTYSSLMRRLQAGGADLGAGSAKPRKDILARLQAEQTAAGTVYKWANGTVAVIDNGTTLRWRSGSAAEAAALAAVAQSKGWTSVQLAPRATQGAADAAWLEYMKRGIAVENHKPSEEVYATYLRWRDGVDAKNETRVTRESAPASKQRDGDPESVQQTVPAGSPDRGSDQGQAGAGQSDPRAEQQNQEAAGGTEQTFAQEAVRLTPEDERVLWLGMHRTLERWARRAPSRAGEEIRKRLPAQVAELVKQEQDQNRRRQLIAQLAANATTQRPPRNLQDARDLLAATPRPGAVQDALTAAKDQYKPTFTPKPGQDITFEPGI